MDRFSLKSNTLHAADSRVKIICHEGNFSQQLALLSGFKHCAGEVVVIMDDDLQHPPEDINRLIDVLNNNKNLDVAIGSYQLKHHTPLRNLGTWLIANMTRRRYGLDNGLRFSSFYALRGSIARKICNMSEVRPRIGHLVLSVTPTAPEMLL